MLRGRCVVVLILLIASACVPEEEVRHLARKICAEAHGDSPVGAKEEMLLRVDQQQVDVGVRGRKRAKRWARLMHAPHLKVTEVWRPFAHHHLLSTRQRWLVLPVFWAAALAFVAILLAISTVLLGLADMALEG